MSTDNSAAISQIGEAAGRVWHILHKDGPLSVAKLVEAAEVNRDLVMQAVGWLAREGKLEITESKRGRTLSLCKGQEGL